MLVVSVVAWLCFVFYVCCCCVCYVSHCFVSMAVAGVCCLLSYYRSMCVCVVAFWFGDVSQFLLIM